MPRFPTSPGICSAVNAPRWPRCASPSRRRSVRTASTAGRTCRPNNPIDHVLPWSLVGIDGLANLVLACARCNGDKSGALPAVAIVDRVLERERDVLEEIASALQWPTQHERVVAAARGIYRGQPAGVPTWSGYQRSERLDISFPPWWVRQSLRHLGWCVQKRGHPRRQPSGTPRVQDDHWAGPDSLIALP